VKFKLDENLSPRHVALLVAAGLDACSVRDQNLQGSPDPIVIGKCTDEGRCLVTLDGEFGNPLTYPPDRHRGIVLLRLPHNARGEDIDDVVLTLRDALTAQNDRSVFPNPLPGPDRHLWIVQRGRIRVFDPSPESPS
jgi:predicted nuclease of predicted toxin-antitoxin system